MHRYIGEQRQHQQQLLSYGDTTISNAEGLESYAVKHIIGRGSHSVVHLATCTRGRLRGRDVALKFVLRPLPTPSLESMHVATTALHKSVHHPAVVALHSAFTIPDYHCLILELCEGGSLWDFLNSQTKEPPVEDLTHEDSLTDPIRLTEAQLRPVLRPVVEGLSYLHSRGIIYTDLNTRKIYLTADGRAKLGGFGGAVPTTTLPSNNDENNASGSSKAVMVGPLRCGIQANMQALGDLIFTLLVGTPPKTTNISGHITSDFPKRNTIPENFECSKDAQAVIAALLKYNPDTRSPLDEVLSLPFFHSTQYTQSLSRGTSNLSEIPPDCLKTSKKDNTPPLCRGIQVHLDAPPIEKARPLEDQANITETHRLHHIPPTLVAKKRVSSSMLPIESHIVPRPRLASGSSTAACSSIRDTWTKLKIRQKPIAREGQGPRFTTPTSESPVTEVGTPTSFHTGNVERKALAEVGNNGRPSTSGKARGEMYKNRAMAKGLLSPAETHYRGTPTHGEPRVIDPLVTSPPPSPPLPTPPSTIHASSSSTGIQPTNSLTAFKIPPLFPQTHKLAHGQLVVLPSRSLLIDLREGERRAGRRGERVMCVSADGQEISVYGAPHLSTPCILSEPLATWTLPMLPPRYWETYIFASKFVESIKKRTPSLVWYTPQAKFTLMSNGPQSDLHAAFPCPSPGTRRRRGALPEVETSTQMRIVLSRARGTVEVARFTGGGWVTTLQTHTAEKNQTGFREDEQAALECVLVALKVCEFAEAHGFPASSTAPAVMESPAPEDTDG